ncbi:hypothetical protein [Aureimonas pseudogalii]|uniref:Uncharacterized protein n=1 Tax=Aureimonas pseudogalii TaxID=1744844 RepID=A0A7W6MM62_9HYPH|nr:hypothetical protein [Aureimonas pseudogalii]MBB4000480.1 hypothetical protein [Aureimonas pseudogalii]
MAKFQMQVETAHPVLFLTDDASDILIPEDTGASFVTVTRNCLTFWVMSFVDGASCVTVSDQACEADGRKLFSGSIDASSGVVTLTDSSGFRYLNVPVPSGRVAISVYADDDRNPDWVWLQLGAIREI